ncbi:helix-hairpin-helix domain-containing protein [Phaeobacter sp. JH18-32]|uniref:helix-hairpin-helix domain-containing protein n=1 Tax=Phaeobacter TaxID=302485 RepID=UPI003A85C989
MTSIATLPGVGPALAQVLAQNGCATVEAVAGKTPEELSRIPRIGRLRAQKLVAEARKAQRVAKGAGTGPDHRANGATPATAARNGADTQTGDAAQLSSALAAAEAARRAAEAKAERAVTKAKKAAKQAAALAEEFAAAKVKAKAKAKRVKAKAKRAIEKEKAKAKAILEAKNNPKKDGGKKDGAKKDAKKEPAKKASARKETGKKEAGRKKASAKKLDDSAAAGKARKK